MAETKYVHLPAHLRRWGLRVEEEPGWRFRGRPYAWHPRAIVCHHTASAKGSGNFASLRVVRDGRSDLPGPLAQFLLGRDGTVRIISGGYANHAGEGGPLAGMPRNMGNTYAWGIEAENNGIGEPWPAKQLNAYYQLCAALLDLMGTKDVSRVIGHKEWTPRKIDPAGINMDHFRTQVKKALSAGDRRPRVRLSYLTGIGKRNADVLAVKKKLKSKGFFHGVLNNYFGTGLKAGYRNWQRHLGYSGHDADGIPGRSSLEKLGFRVVDGPK